MQPDTKIRFNWGYLIMGILFLALGFVAIFTPLANLSAVAYLFAIFAILLGLWQITRYAIDALYVILGVLDIIFGIVIIFNISWAVLALPILFALWFVLDSIFRLCMLGYVRRMFGYGVFWLSLILNLLALVCGVVLMFHPFLSAMLVSGLMAAYLLLSGIDFIVYAFPHGRIAD